MKKLVFITLTFMITTFSIAQSKEEKEVASAIEALRVAMIDGNKAALESVAAEELSYGHSGGHVENKAEFVDKIVSGKSDFVTIELSNQTIKVVGNTAVVRHDLAATTNDGGNTKNINLHILLVFQKQHGKWKLLARQAVKLVSKE
jgi:Domain of unknown function (DUF4440)